MADRIDALRFALERIARAAAANQDWDTQRTALYALAEDKHAEQAQYAAQQATHDGEVEAALASGYANDTCGYCGEPCILDPHFACAMEQAQRG